MRVSLTVLHVILTEPISSRATAPSAAESCCTLRWAPSARAHSKCPHERPLGRMPTLSP